VSSKSWVIASLLAALALAALTLCPPSMRVQTGLPRLVEHFIGFAVLGALASLASRRWILPVFAFGLVAILALEAAQLVMPGRHARISDVIVNAVAFSAGLIGLTLLRRRGVLSRAS
jgi:VanZ family protein